MSAFEGMRDDVPPIALYPRLLLLRDTYGIRRLVAEVASTASSMLLLIAVVIPGDWVSSPSILLTMAPALTLGLLLTILFGTERRPGKPVLRSAPAQVLVGTSGGLFALSVTILLATFDGDRLKPILGGIVIVTLLSLWVREFLRVNQHADLLGRLTSQATTDPLTGVGNRRSLATAMDDLFALDGPLAVLTIDLDRFKEINTLLGHHIGDELLIAVAAKIRRECGLGRTFRLGGDEFAVLTLSTPAQAEELGARLMSRIEELVGTIPGTGQVDVAASIGIAHRYGEGTARVDPATILNRSAEAMRAAKVAGRARVVTFGGKLAQQQHRRRVVERRLRQAVAEDRIELWIQPVISLSELRMVGGELLARWTDDELGPVSPAEFIPAAEDCGLIVELGLQLTRSAMRIWKDVGAAAAGLTAGVNVSAAQLRMPWFATMVDQLLAEIGVAPELLTMEVTESVQIEDNDPAVAMLWRLADMGISVSLDDFGTGFSSLSLLSRLPIRGLKLDRSLTQQLHEPRGNAIARCVTEMAHDLHVDVVAEGIETPQQLEAARRLEVGFGQGWLFARAIPPTEFAELVRDPSWLQARLIVNS